MTNVQPFQLCDLPALYFETVSVDWSMTLSEAKGNRLYVEVKRDPQYY